MKKLIIILACLLLGTFALEAQRLEMRYNETSAYPKVTTGFKLYDAGGNEIRNLGQVRPIKKTDIVIQEYRNGIIHEQNPIDDPDCPRADQTTFSAILVVDISTSMAEEMDGKKRRLDVLKEVLMDFIKNFDPKRTEVAITLFAGDAIGHPDDINNKPFQPFTTDKEELTASVKSIENMYAGTNWNAAFLHKNGKTYKEDLSALYYCHDTVRKYKPVIIFLTDGDHIVKGSVTAFELFKVRQIALERNASIYCIQFSDVPIEQAQNQTDFIELARVGRRPQDGTDNHWLQIYSASQLKNIYNTILDEAGSFGDPPPCYVTWETSCEGGSATFNFPKHGMLVGETQFTLAPSKLPKLQITPTPFHFKNVPPGQEQEQTITLKALQNYVDITDINILNDAVFQSKRATGRYIVSDWGVRKPPPIRIPEDSTYFIKVKYIPEDSLYSEAHIEFVSSACSGKNFVMTGEMYPFVERIDMGTVAIGGPDKEDTFTQVFCNKTGKKINISRIRIDGTDKAEFELVSYSPKPANIDSGECVTMTFKFKPRTEPPGIRTAKIIVETDYNNNMKFEGELVGNAAGGKTMTSENPGFDSVSCTVPTTESIIVLENAGNIPITGVTATLDDNTNFSIKTAPIATITAGGTTTVVVEFHPTTIRNNDYIATLTVVSDAENSPYKINLKGLMRNIDYTVTGTLAFGEVCVNNPQTKSVTITNIGNVPLDVKASIPAPFNLATTDYYIAVGGNAPVNIECAPKADGLLNVSLAVNNTECPGENQTSAITATGVKPLIQIDKQISLTAIIGANETVKYIITNKSVAPLKLSAITAVDPTRFKVQNITPALTNPIAPNGTVSFDVVYTPITGDKTVLKSGIQFTGTTCNVDTTIDAYGNPGQATVNIEIDDYTGFEGMKYDFDIFLRSGKKFSESGTTKINTTIKFDGSLLVYDGTDPVSAPDANKFRTITLTNISVQAKDTEQKIYTLKFTVNKTGANNSTVLEILNTSGVDGGASFIPNNGLFSLNPASAKLAVKDFTAQPGEEKNIVIEMTDAVNISNAVNQNIEVDMYFNGSLLEPLSSSYIKTKTFVPATKKWKLELVLPCEAKANNVLATIPVRVMLGNAKISDLELDSASIKVKSGGASFTRTNGKFTLDGICTDENGTQRLFNPYVNASIISINPNPSDGIISIEYETSEQGQTKMWVSDLLGNTVLVLLNKVPEQGIADLSFDATQLPNGVYFVIMQTPTQVFRKQIYIAR